MKSKTIITVVLLAFVVVSVVYLVIKESAGPATSPTEPQTKETPQRRIVAYYFHGNMRCMTCRTIEAYTKQAIETGFPEALKDGRLEFRVLNLDDPGNEHFAEDYQLTTRSVVIVEFEHDKQKRWKNLEQVWELVGDEQAFLKYVQDQTHSYLEAKD